MIDKKYLLNNMEEIKEKLKNKGFSLNIQYLIKSENKKRKAQEELETLQREKNKNAEKIKKLKSDGVSKVDLNDLIRKGALINKKIDGAKKKFESINKSFKNYLLEIPNIPDESVPIGDNEDDNVEIKKHLNPTVFDFSPKDHVDLTKEKKGLDFQSGVKLSKSRFVIMRNDIAKLHRALSQFMLDLHTEENGYQEINVPLLVNRDTLKGTGQLPKFEEDLFFAENGKLGLIPTAEVPLTNLVRNNFIEEEELPIKLTAHSLCFRSESNSSGLDVKGILRQHQFEKVELVQIVKAEDSERALQEILNNAENVLKMLKLPYRVVELCTGDLGFGAKKTFDIEVWIPSQNTYREISSCSNMGDFQSRRMNAKIKYKDGVKEFPHTLNGSALAVGRTLLAILENYQTKEGNVIVPEVLVPYMKKELIVL